MTPLDPKYHKRFQSRLPGMMVKTGALYDMRNDCMVYRFEASDGETVTVCNLPVPHILKNQKVDLFELADQAADQIKAKMNEIPGPSE